MKTRIKEKIMGRNKKYICYIPQVKIKFIWKDLIRWYGNYEHGKGFTDSRIVFGKRLYGGHTKEYAQECIEQLKKQLENKQGFYKLGYYPVMVYF